MYACYASIDGAMDNCLIHDMYCSYIMPNEDYLLL